MEKPRLDLSKTNCHACGKPLNWDIGKQTEWCTHFACLIRNIDFTIPVMQEDIKDEPVFIIKEVKK